MNYKGIKLQEITKPQVFDPPKEMLVWNSISLEPKREVVIAIVTSEGYPYAICDGLDCYPKCAEIPEIPEEPKPKRATNRELSKWITQYGELTYDLNTVYHEFSYNEPDRENPVTNGIFIRKWEDTDWHEPTVDYMGMAEK